MPLLPSLGFAGEPFGPLEPSHALLVQRSTYPGWLLQQVPARLAVTPRWMLARYDPEIGARLYLLKADLWPALVSLLQHPSSDAKLT